MNEPKEKSGAPNSGDPEPSEVLGWVRAATAGDPAAMQRLLIGQHDRLRNLVARSIEPRMRARLDPEDILQDAYADACRTVADCSFDTPGGFFSWLQTIVRNKITDHQRGLWSEKRDPRREVRATQRTSYGDLFDRLQASGKTPSRMAARREGAAVIATSMAQLKDEYRQVIQLRFLEGLPVSEVMEIMGKTEGSVHMLCHRALKELRVLMRSASRFISLG
jgi:RNA polymerase sigma-70 factor (ECF subfamily)